MSAFCDDEELLLTEFNHRIFNTFQMLTGALAHCVRVEDDGALRRLLLDLVLRMKALAGLHRLLACPAQAWAFEEHCRALCMLLVSAFDRETVTPWVCMDDIPLTGARRLRLSLIVVELVTNVLKHSLTDEDGGTVWVTLHAGLDQVELLVRDSRNGLISHTTPSRIVQALAQGIGGEVSIKGGDGYAAAVRFPIDEPQPRQVLRGLQIVREQWTPYRQAPG
jgi:two-component sensor histidine kinase